MKKLNEAIAELNLREFSENGISIRPICDDYDLWYVVVECKLAPGQEEFVNPAGFTIGRAYLNPGDNVPCIIWKDGQWIGYMVLRMWHDGTGTSWSYYLDRRQQGMGYGISAAKSAVRILKGAVPDLPVKLAVEKCNDKARRLYASLGFRRTDEMDGDDLIFVLE